MVELELGPAKVKIDGYNITGDDKLAAWVSNFKSFGGPSPSTPDPDYDLAQEFVAANPGAQIIKYIRPAAKNDTVLTVQPKLHVGLKGGMGSGNHGHAGRPGHLGGSMPGAGGSGLSWSQPLDKAGRPIPIQAKTVAEAARLVLQGKVVEVKDVRTAYTLVSKLARDSNAAKAAGKAAKNYDLCNVSVAGTNMFCGGNVGVPRLKMPQLSGVPKPGSQADKLPRNPWDKTEVNAAGQFTDYLHSIGIKTATGTVPAAKLRASQSQLEGTKVAAMMTDAKFDPAKNPIFISRDNYVVDGHHRWAAIVGRDAADGHLGDSSMHVVRIDAPISEVLHIANKWSTDFGIQQVGIKQIIIRVGTKGGSGSGNWGHAGRTGKEGGSMAKGKVNTMAPVPIKPGQPGVAGAAGKTLEPSAVLALISPTDTTGYQAYKTWYASQGTKPSLGDAIRMRAVFSQHASEAAGIRADQARAAAEAYANSPEGKAAAARAEADLAAASGLNVKKGGAKKGKGKAAKKPAAPKAPKAAAEKKPAAAKEPKWKKGLVEPASLSFGTAPDPIYGERGEQTYQKWLSSVKNPDTLNAADKQAAYDYFVKRSKNLAKYAADAPSQVVVPALPFDMVDKGLSLPDDNSVMSVFDNVAEYAAVANPAQKLAQYISTLDAKGQAAMKALYQARLDALDTKKRLAAGQKEAPRIIIRVGLKGGPTSGNRGHGGRPGKVGGSVPRTGLNPVINEQVKLKFKLAARSSVPEFSNATEAQAWLQKAYPDTNFVIDGVEPVILNPTLQTYNALAQQFPDAADNIKSVKVQAVTSDYIVAGADPAGQNIMLNSTWYHNSADLRESTRDAVKAGFYPQGATVKHYIASAYGDAMHGWLRGNQVSANIVSNWIINHTATAGQISMAAQVGPMSLFSEAFAGAFATKINKPIYDDFRSMLDNAVKLRKKLQ